jgi:tetratricopeptide (TPR) repeat protein
VDQRERWQALQSHLSSARAYVDAGDRGKALEAIDAALAIDPDFLAALSLRDCILAPPAPMIGSAHGDTATPTNPAASRLTVSANGYAKFEARAKRRRVDRRLDAARAALERRQLKDAAAALDEIIELDPNLPELSELTTSFDALSRANATTTRRGPWIAAAASFAVVIFGASWLQQTQPLASIQTTGAAMPVEPPAPAPVVDTDIVEVAVEPPAAPVGTGGADAVNRDSGFGIRVQETMNAEMRSSGTASRGEPRLATPDSRIAPAESRTAPSDSRLTNPESRIPNPGLRVPNAEPPTPSPIEMLAAPAPAAPPTPSIMSAMTPAPAPMTVPVSAPVLPRIDPSDEVVLVKQTLQRYRSAYDGLDAPSAQAVYPAVNQAALARAFDGLESQTLTFDTCDVQLRGDAATATCRGSARYVPKIGSREPRVEPRTWNFTLRKAGDDWRIDTARAER